ncbi:MAG: putative Ig domain-containing protein [Candidatus Wenzhouxiangella sp. M2_3B_020]
MKLSSLLLAAGLAVFLPARVTAGAGEIMFVNSFEGTGNVPQFVPVDEQATAAGRSLVVDVDTSDPANQAGLTFSLTDAPSGMSIRANDGEIEWTPTEDQVGTDSVTVHVEDLAGLANTLTFGVRVVDPSASPLIDPIPDQTALVGDAYQYLVVASDPDPGDAVTFSLDSGPAGLVIDAASGLLNWMPAGADAGAHPITVRASDGSGQSDIETFGLTVVADNQPPTLAAIPDRGAAPGVTMSVQAQAIDPDAGDTLIFSLPSRPTGMTVDATTGLLQWTPTPLQLGPHPVTVTVADPFGFSDAQSFEVFVDHNRPPVAVDDGGYRVERGDTLVAAPEGVLANDTDPNDDLLSARLETGPVRGTLTLDADGGFAYTPDNPGGTIGVTEKWRFLDSGGIIDSAPQPLIANLDDDPAAEIFIIDNSGCCTRYLTALDGETGTVDWERVFTGRQLSINSKPAIADIDLDGKPEIVVVGGETDALVTSHTKLYAFEHDGHIKWISEPLGERLFPVGSNSPTNEGVVSEAAITLADLDGDGTPEILVAPGAGTTVNARVQIWDNEGRKLESYAEPDTSMGRETRTTVVDLDLDGDPEIVVGNVAWSHDGDLLWARKDNFSSFQAVAFPIVANLDDDPYPELVRTRGGSSFPDNRGNVVAWNHDGTDLLTPAGTPWEVARPLGFNKAPMSIADVDGDGFADVLQPWRSESDRFDVLDGRDGSLKWSKSVTTRTIGATTMDMDGDGFVEVLFVDEFGQLHVWDGRNGAEKGVFDLDTARPTNWSMPVFADIDADGVAELVVPGGVTSGSTAVSVWESPTDDWPPMRSIWNQQRYHVTNVNDDLTIPARERPHWLLPGLNQAMINGRLPEARTEEHDSFTYRASDGEFDSNAATVAITILPPNAPPRIVSTPKTLASPGFEYVYRALAVDADAGETLAWSLADGPAGMTMDALGSVRWTPSFGDLGEHTVAIEVTDSVGVSAFQAFVVDVVPAVTVPDLAGLTEGQAVAAVEAAELVVDPLRDTFSDVVPAGEVASQQPPPGTAIEAGGSVEVEISRGPVPVQVPDTIALDLADALAALAGAGLSAGTVEFANDDRQPADTVLGQDPAPRALAPPGSSVDLTVSGGPRAVIAVTPSAIPAGSTATVAVSVRDVDGTPLDPQPAVTLALDMDPTRLSGTPPALAGSTITTFVDSQGPFDVEASFDAEVHSTGVVVTQPISDGPGADVYSEFAGQLDQYRELIDQLIEAVETNDTATILATDTALADLLTALDTRRLRTLSPIAPDGGVPPAPSIAEAAGFAPGPHDQAYREVTLDLLVVTEQLEEVLTEGTAPDAVIEALNQELAETASALAALEPDVFGVLDASGIVISLLGTRVPRLLRADIEAVRRELRDAGIVTAAGKAGAARFTLPGLMSATRIRSTIVNDFYVPYLGDVARAMGTIIAADLLQPYANGGAVVGIVTGGSLALHVFEIPNSVVEGFGFDPTLSPNNAVTMVGPELFDAVQNQLGGLPSAEDFRDLNSIMDAVQTQVDNADAVGKAWDEANTSPMGVRRGCILDGSPGCRQLIYPNGFASVYQVDSGLSLPAPVIVIVRNLESGGMALFVANFVPTRDGG